MLNTFSLSRLLLLLKNSFSIHSSFSDDYLVIHKKYIRTFSYFKGGGDGEKKWAEL